jgi:hypothetical protein
MDLSVSKSCDALQAVERLYNQLKQNLEHTEESGKIKPTETDCV